MKNYLGKLLVVVVITSLLSNCNKSDEPDVDVPNLPPVESMKVDFAGFTSSAKSAGELEGDTTAIAFTSSVITVAIWNTMLTVTLVVPVTAFYNSFNYDPSYIGDRTWQWSYDITALGGTYSARLTGEVRDEDIKWEMYVSKEGVGAFNEFKWFEGTSDFDGNGGQWILYHSYSIQEEVMQIDWEKVDDEIGSIKYSYIRESDNGVSDQLTDDSYLEYGLQDGDYNAFYNIIYNQRDRDPDSTLSVNIEWSTSDYYGRIKAAHYFNDDDNWHCWDTAGYDVVCE